MKKLLTLLFVACIWDASVAQCDFTGQVTNTTPACETTTGSLLASYIPNNCPDGSYIYYEWFGQNQNGLQLLDSGTIPFGPIALEVTFPLNEYYTSITFSATVYDVNDVVLGEIGSGTFNVIFPAPDITEDWFNLSCDGHCFTLEYGTFNYWSFIFDIDGVTIPPGTFYYAPYCMDDGIHIFSVTDVNGCTDSYIFEVTGPLQDNNNACNTAIPLASGVTVTDEICSTGTVTAECGTYPGDGSDWFVINSGSFGQMDIGLQLLDTVQLYQLQVWESPTIGDCSNLSIFSCDNLNEVSGCFLATSETALMPNTDYYIQLISNTGVSYEITVLLSDEPQSLCGCTDPNNCNYDPDAIVGDYSCGYEGCTNPSACNYVQWATCDDGSCVFGNSFIAQLFYDVNGDGIWQSTGFFAEPALGNTGTISILELGVTLFPNNNGAFIFPNVPLGEYTIEYVDNDDVWTLSTGDTFTLTLPTCDGANIGLIPSNETTLQVSGPCCIWMMDIHCVNGMNPGLWVQNTGNVPLNGTFTMTFDPLLVPEYLSGAAPWTSYSNGVMVWEIVDQAPGTSVLYQCHIVGPGAEYAGQVFPFGMELNLVDDQGNSFYTENWVLEPTVICSYDPNDKYSVPVGYTEEHFVLAEDEIEYRIRFQNTGTASAETVIIEDQLDLSRLDISTFDPVFASHSFNTVLHDDGGVQFVFSNIQLPDSASDEPGSQGYVVYRIKSLPGLEGGDVINNTASIFFDDNLPIVTNTTWHTIFDCDSFSGISGESTFCSGAETSFDASQDYVENYAWSVDDEFVSNESSPLIVISEPGIHTIAVDVSNPLCGITDALEVEVLQSPTANAGNDQEICLGDEAILSAEGGVLYSWDNNLGDGQEHTVSPTENTTYTVTVFNELDCTDMDEVSILVHPVPGISINESGATLTGPDGTSWQWYLNGNPIEGANDQVYLAVESGDYSVETVNQYNCLSASEIVTVVVDIQESETITFLLYPNPAVEKVILVVPSGKWTYEIFDASGKCWMSSNDPNSRTFSIDCSDFPSGNYLISLVDGNGITEQLKLVVE